MIEDVIIIVFARSRQKRAIRPYQAQRQRGADRLGEFDGPEADA